MKRLILLITVLLIAISAAAQANTVGISAASGQLMTARGNVYGTTWNTCVFTCTDQCLAAKKGTRDQCDKMCVAQCHPQPDVITRKLPPVQIPPPMPVREDCPGMCKRLASQSPISYAAAAGLNFEVFMTCMHDRCKQDCESSCRMIYGNAAQDCVQKECAPQAPQTCEDGCKIVADECQKAGINDKSCEKKIRDCYRQCRPQVPQTCEDRCGMIKGDCEKTGVDPQVCQKKIRDCLRDCQPQCPQCPECPPAEVPCEQRCKMVADECLKAGVDVNSCRMKIRACLRECQPQPPESCEDNCAKVKVDCDANNLDEKSCQMKIRACWRDCQSQTEYRKITECPPKDCQDNCVDGYYSCADIAKTMKAEVGDPATVLEYYMTKCRRGVAECLDSCRPAGLPGQPDMNAVNPRLPNRKEMVGLNPQPEPPMPARETREVSLLGRIWHIFTG